MADNKTMTKREQEALDRENTGSRAKRIAAIRARGIQAETGGLKRGRGNIPLSSRDRGDAD